MHHKVRVLFESVKFSLPLEVGIISSLVFWKLLKIPFLLPPKLRLSPMEEEEEEDVEEATGVAPKRSQRRKAKPNRDRLPLFVGMPIFANSSLALNADTTLLFLSTKRSGNFSGVTSSSFLCPLLRSSYTVPGWALFFRKVCETQ